MPAALTHHHEREVATLVVRRLKEAGHEAYFVGGCVRELLLGGDPADFDVTTSATPDDVVALFPKVVEVGKQFGVVMVVQDDVVIEVATFRTEGAYSDGRRPDSVRFATAQEDVSRRDFTINALLLDPESGEVVDHVGGRADLARKVLRTVGDARLRFAEDRLRMLRAARFTARLGFEMDAATRAACRELAPQVTSVSAERVRDELSRMLSHRTRGTAVRLLDDLSLLAHVLPEVHALKGVPRSGCSCADSDAFEHVVASVTRLRPGASLEAAWATLLHDVGLSSSHRETQDGATFASHAHAREGAAIAERVAARLKLSNRERERIVALVRDHQLPRESAQWKLSKLRQVVALPMFEDLLDVARAEGDSENETTAGIAWLEQARLRWGAQLPPALLTGDDVAAAGVPRGPEMGRILDVVRAEQLEEMLSTKEQALARVKELLAES